MGMGTGTGTLMLLVGTVRKKGHISRHCKKPEEV